MKRQAQCRTPVPVVARVGVLIPKLIKERNDVFQASRLARTLYKFIDLLLIGFNRFLKPFFYAHQLTPKKKISRRLCGHYRENGLNIY